MAKPKDESLPLFVDDLLGYQLRRASVAFMSDLSERLAELDLRPSVATILFLIEASPGVSPSELGRMLQIKRSNMTPLAAALESRGLVKREGLNGRSHGFSLTAAGIELVARARAIVMEHEARFSAIYAPEEAAMLVSLLKRAWESSPAAEPERRSVRGG